MAKTNRNSHRVYNLNCQLYIYIRNIMEFLKLLYIYHKLMHFLVLIIKNIDYFEIYGLLIVSYLANLM